MAWRCDGVAAVVANSRLMKLLEVLQKKNNGKASNAPTQTHKYALVDEQRKTIR